MLWQVPNHLEGKLYVIPGLGVESPPDVHRFGEFFEFASMLLYTKYVAKLAYRHHLPISQFFT